MTEWGASVSLITTHAFKIAVKPEHATSSTTQGMFDAQKSIEREFHICAGKMPFILNSI